MTSESQSIPLEHICVVLVEPSHPGNIGAAARAMKTMGLGDLRLVNPGRMAENSAQAMAAGAGDVLHTASASDHLADAVADCTHVVGTTARMRKLSSPILSPRAGAAWVARARPSERAALVFGRERTGLSNEEALHCHRLVRIDANPEYASLNLAAAVQLLCYECRVAVATAGKSGSVGQGEFLAPASDVEDFFQHLRRVLVRTGFLDPAVPRYLMPRLRRLFNRAQLEGNEVNILRGILTSVETGLDRGSAEKDSDD